ncbi:hypothetical protein HanIR_Chr01g0042561 [Helianthus annuus]|nr:hypothetical protein HanIR_Chr01g0042561 [Helianthus annuus]
MESKSGWALTVIQTLQIREFTNTWFYKHNALQIQSFHITGQENDFKFVFSILFHKLVIQKIYFKSFFYKQTMNSLNFMLTFSHVSFSGCISKLRHGWNRRAIRDLST